MSMPASVFVNRPATLSSPRWSAQASEPHEGIPHLRMADLANPVQRIVEVPVDFTACERTRVIEQGVKAPFNCRSMLRLDEEIICVSRVSSGGSVGATRSKDSVSPAAAIMRTAPSRTRLRDLTGYDPQRFAQGRS